MSGQQTDIYRILPEIEGIRLYNHLTIGSNVRCWIFYIIVSKKESDIVTSEFPVWILVMKIVDKLLNITYDVKCYNKKVDFEQFLAEMFLKENKKLQELIVDKLSKKLKEVGLS